MTERYTPDFITDSREYPDSWDGELGAGMSWQTNDEDYIDDPDEDDGFDGPIGDGPQ
jgi:hypothetical protein